MGQELAQERGRYFFNAQTTLLAIVLIGSFFELA
jgi:hypothetical protein